MNIVQRVSLVFMAGLWITLNGCGVQRAVVRSALHPVIDGGMTAMLAEPDLDIARTALASNLKLVEGLLVEYPDDPVLLHTAAQGFTAYALAFAEDENRDTARDLYTRGRDYANRWLIAETGVDLLAIDGLDEFNAAVAELDEEALPGLFWLGNAWGSRILLNLNDISSIANLPRVEAIMRKVLVLDEGYFHGFAHLFFGGYYGGRPAMLGGDLDKADHHLRTQIEMTDGKVLFGTLFLVRYVHLSRLDGEAARGELERILAFDVEAAPPETILLNRVAQAKARRLLDSLDEYL